jgi:hypothetical protein
MCRHFTLRLCGFPVVEIKDASAADTQEYKYFGWRGKETS